jgi:hypothetical protein
LATSVISSLPTVGSGFTANSNTLGVGSASQTLLTEYQLLTSSSSPLAITSGMVGSGSWVSGGAAFLETITNTYSPWIYGDQCGEVYG